MIDELLRRWLLLPPRASALAGAIDHLHYAVILITMFGVLAISLLAIALCIRYRARAPSDGRARHDSSARPTPPWAELALVLGVFGLFLGLWGVGFQQYVRMSEAPPGSYDIYVSGQYSTPLTISAGDNIVITGNLTTSLTGTATLGLVANQFVRVMHGVKSGSGCTGGVIEDSNHTIDNAVIEGPLIRVTCTGTGTHAGRPAFRCSAVADGISYPFFGVVNLRARRVTYCKRDAPPVPSLNIPLNRRCLA